MDGEEVARWPWQADRAGEDAPTYSAALPVAEDLARQLDALAPTEAKAYLQALYYSGALSLKEADELFDAARSELWEA